MHILGLSPGFRSPHVLEELIKVTGGAFIVIGTRSFLDPASESVTAVPLKARFSPHGVLPAQLLALLCLVSHALVILAGGAIVKIAAGLGSNNACLHPETGVGAESLFVFHFLCSFRLNLICPVLRAKEVPKG